MTHRVFPPRSQRRRSSWATGPETPVSLDFFGDDSKLVQNAFKPAEDGHTIVRIHGIAEFVLGPSVSPGDGFFGALGFGVADDVQFASGGGSGSIPSPLASVGWEGWMVHQFFSFHASVAGSSARFDMMIIDSKAKRKIGAEEVLFAKISVIEAGASALSVIVKSRVLTLLP